MFENIFTNEDKDTHLLEKLTTDSELSGLLNLALIGLRQLIKDNGFIHTDDIATVEREYNMSASTVERFLAEKCTINHDRKSFEICRDLYSAYFRNCKENKFTPMADNAFGSEILQRGIKKERQRVNGCREWCYVGISVIKSPSISPCPYSSPSTSASLTNFGDRV